MDREVIFQGVVVDLGIEQATGPDGARFPMEVIRHPGGAAVVALDDQQRVCLIRQYRHCAGGWIIEIPAGKLEPDEPAFETARRELAEEVGLEAHNWQSLGDILTAPGFCDEVLYLYLARDLTSVPTNTEQHEYIEIEWVPLGQALDWVQDNTLRDAKTIIALIRAAALLESSA